MKIALVYDLLYPFSIGGAEIRNYQLAEFLSESGHEVHLFGVKMWHGKDIIKKGSILIHGICRYKDRYSFSGNRRITDIIRFSKALKRKLKKYKFDLVDCCSFPYFPVFICRDYCKKNMMPLVITWHEIWQDYWHEKLGLLGFLGKYIEKKIARISKNNLAVSKKTGEALLRINKNKQSIKVINNWIDFNELIKTRPSKLESDIIFAGRLLKHKNVDVLIKSLELVKKEFPNIRLIIVGNGPEERKLNALTKKMKLQNNITFFDFFKEHNDVISLMKSSKVFVLPSTLEGFGISVIEANSCRLPCLIIKSKDNAAVNLIKDNYNGFKTALNEKELAEKIIYFLKNKEKRHKIGQKAYIFSKLFDKDLIMPKIENYYMSLK